MIQCPECKNDKEFAIDAVVLEVAYVTQHLDDDPDYEAGGLELIDTKRFSGTQWDGESSCRCLICQHVAPLDSFDPEPVPALVPQKKAVQVWVVIYEHKHGVDVSVYSTEQKAWNGIDYIKSQFPEDFDEDDPRGWCDITACRIDT